VLGIHLEGPFLNPARKGVHPPEHLVPWRPATPISCPPSAPGRHAPHARARARPAGLSFADLRRRGVVVSAGHTDGTAAEILPALDEGCTGFTHLFNAMSPLAGASRARSGTALADAPRLRRDHRRRPPCRRPVAARRLPRERARSG
jgi:N-acetylglucosamine-6-phosphate deacetylase